MHFERTRHYYEAATKYREALRNIWADYDKKMQKIEQYAGSKGYEDDKATADKERDAAIKALQREYGEKFDSILKGMRESATTRSMTPPTQEQLALLQALKMRDRISRDELEQAGRTLKDSPVCLSVLEEIAHNLMEKTGSHEYYGLRFVTEGTAGILHSIDNLTESARRICALNKCDSKREMVARTNVHNAEWESNALYSFQVDRDVTSTREAMGFFGGVSNLESFEAAVNE
jgi:hypothetical protein